MKKQVDRSVASVRRISIVHLSTLLKVVNFFFSTHGLLIINVIFPTCTYITHANYLAPSLFRTSYVPVFPGNVRAVNLPQGGRPAQPAGGRLDLQYQSFRVCPKRSYYGLHRANKNKWEMADDVQIEFEIDLDGSYLVVLDTAGQQGCRKTACVACHENGQDLNQILHSPWGPR